ncbi:MAG: hypothetical protein AAB975_02935, partial [Patescibacteria group bacterium]
ECMTTRVIKFSLGALGIALVGFGALYALRFFSPEYRQEQEAMRRLEAIERQYQNDTYGGDTPEETLRLFIDALKKEDIDLAAKYFVIDKQEEWLGNLQKIKEKNMLAKMVKDLERERYRDEISQTLISYTIANDQKEVALTIYMTQISNGIWKIERM